jgi:hypothetical protein
MFTTSMIGSQKYHDLQVFPLDPNDLIVLRKEARDDGIVIYLRLFYNRKYQTVVVIESPRNLNRIWEIFQQHQSSYDTLQTSLVESIYHAFVEDSTEYNVEKAKLSMKLLCLLNYPELRHRTTAPRANICGVIHEFTQRIVTDYCYIQFALDDIPDLVATHH